MYENNNLFVILLVLVITCFNADFIAANCVSECSKNAECVNYNEEYCCECSNGFIGNGVNCFQQDDQISLRGKITGSINGIKLEEQDSQAYVYTLASDARNYVAIGRVPTELGNKLTLILPFATPIHWIFAGSSSNALNGFSLTGGVFSRQSDSTFFNEQGDVIGNLYINQNFTGLNEDKREINFDTFIEATLPELNENEQVIYPDYDENYVYKSNVENPSTRKLVETRSNIKYFIALRNDQTRLKQFRIEHNERIHFSVCKSSNEELMKKYSASVQLMTKRLTVSYTQSDSQIRFSSANFIRALNSQEQNPCESNDCNLFAECVVDPETDKGYYCQCKPGFDEEKNECIDVNECEEGSTYCSRDAECINLLGNYECQCIPPKVGNGRVCELETDINQDDVCSRCDPNASCVSDSNSNRYCVCHSGYTGNGFQCQQDSNNSNESENSPLTSTRPRLEHNGRCEECHVYARCSLQTETNGECCVCIEGYVGNGKYCMKDTTPVQVTGTVTGRVNNQVLEDLNLNAYALTHSSDPRNFVAIGNIPPSLEGSFQVLINLVSPINWLFSGRNGIDKNIKVYNGFSLTGGLFTRIASVYFYDESSRQSSSVSIKQEYFGVFPQSNELQELIVKTEIEGTLPNVDPDAQVIFKDFKQEYTKYSPGRIRTNGQLTYEITSIRNSQSFKSYRIDYTDEITYSECPHLNENDMSSTHRVNSKRVFVQFSKGDRIVKFSSANYIYPSDMADDPCELNTCSIYAECVIDSEMPTNYSCVCKVGFEGDGFNCYDIDECESGDSKCDTNAVCYNYIGYHDCSCRAPYTGNGIECNYELECSSCHSNAECVDDGSQKKCVCRSGYYGDGFTCQLDTSDCQCSQNADCVSNYETGRQECKCKHGYQGNGKICSPLPCNEYSNCNENAKCVLNQAGDYECQCLKGYIGDGYQCSTKSCDILNNCGENAACLLDTGTLQHKCQCLDGYSGNGYKCAKNSQTCDELNNCHQFAECLFDEKLNHYICKCKSGFSGDGNYCTPINRCDAKNQNICDANAECVYDSKIRDHICKCKPGFEGNGLKYNCNVDDTYGLYLVYAQGASLHKIVLKSTNEQTNEHISGSSPHKNRIVHVPGQTSVAVAYDCHEQYIYWSDVSSNVINRIRPDGSNYSVVLNNVRSAEGLAIDWISRNLYFTDSETRTIEVASLNGQFRKTLIKKHLSNPRGIAVDPIDGYIFWTDWNRKNPKIERANMDGTQRKVIANTDVGVPNGLYFDQKRQEVCWGDAKTNRIECVEKDGSNRRVVVQINQMYPFDLTEVRTNIYWSDWSRNEIQNVDKSGVINTPIKLSIGGSGRVYGIVAVKNMCPRGTNACDRTNGDCNQLCLPIPDHNRQCACSDEANYECTKTLSP